MPDKYDLQIAELTAFPRLIPDHWYSGRGLFQFATQSGNCWDDGAGCLTLIRLNECLYVKDRPDLTERIKADERIPKDLRNITIESLPVFAEWQRILDKEIRQS